MIGTIGDFKVVIPCRASSAGIFGEFSVYSIISTVYQPSYSVQTGRLQVASRSRLLFELRGLVANLIHERQ